MLQVLASQSLGFQIRVNPTSLRSTGRKRLKKFVIEPSAGTDDAALGGHTKDLVFY